MKSMNSDEKYIELRFGKKMPFKAPEGYMESLSQSIAGRIGADAAAAEPCAADAAPAVRVLPAARKGWWLRGRRYVAAAACTLAAVGCLSAWLAGQGGRRDGDGQAHAVAAHAERAAAGSAYGSVSDDEINYTMLDNEDMYTLMASN